MQEPAVWILIPAHNEAASIGAVINSVKKEGWENILVVNDGRGDETANIAEIRGARVLDLPIHRGQGAALSVGLAYLNKNYTPVAIVTFDADGQHQASDIRKILEPILANRADIALGSRFLDKTNRIPVGRKIVLKAGVVFTKFTSKLNVTDTHNGLRAMNRIAYHNIRLRQRGPEHASEIFDEIVNHNLKYEEVPVHITYSAYSIAKGQKSSNFISIALKFLFHKLTI